ncbi:hypothetical protein EDC16_10517 [Testudinibacter aquarius]|uniref:Uncharacterized protein n=1 Tax=Testudinibacter aquarius TaxID=1524974 RepID=A0A4R3Y5Q1_9PAST|nr:hypothetical protein EDC16_10517 [Testudinibacter aquarius]
MERTNKLINSTLKIAVKNIGSNIEWNSMMLNAFVINKNG